MILLNKSTCQACVIHKYTLYTYVLYKYCIMIVIKLFCYKSSLYTNTLFSISWSTSGDISAIIANDTVIVVSPSSDFTN